MNRRCLKRVRKSWHFGKLLRQGKSYKGSVIRAKYLKNSLGQIRLGFSVSAKTGNAVKRNLFKRRLRQYSVEKSTEYGYDAVIFPVIPLKYAHWAQMKEDMDKLTAEAAERGRKK